jgi:hypothetical protein
MSEKITDKNMHADRHLSEKKLFSTDGYNVQFCIGKGAGSLKKMVITFMF